MYLFLCPQGIKKDRRSREGNDGLDISSQQPKNPTISGRSSGFPVAMCSFSREQHKRKTIRFHGFEAFRQVF
jgi:hypothetical protein